MKKARFVAVAAVQSDEFNCRSRWSDAKPTECAELEFLAPASTVQERAFKVPSLRNVADRAPFNFARPVLATLRTTFDFVALLGDIGALRGRRYGNLVLIAGSRPLPVDELTRQAAKATPPARFLWGERYDELVGDALPMTDAAPADAPVLKSWIYERS